MDEKMAKYICEKIIQDIRNGILLEPEILKYVTNKQYLLYLRGLFVDDDYKYILKYIESNEYAHKRFAFTLLQQIKNNTKVKETVFNYWKNATTYKDKRLVMFNLLDYEDLEFSTHVQIFDFVKSNLDIWLSDTCAFMTNGNIDAILDAVRERISEHKYPPTKHWIYLLIAFSSPSKSSVLDLINEHQSYKYPMNLRVKELFLKLYGKEIE